jgi:RHS repeat-associated protein
MIGTARPASWLPRQGPSASRSASDTRGPISVSPETAVFGRRDRHAAGHALSPSCHRATRPHRPDAHRGHRRFSGHTGGGSYSWARYYHPALSRFLSEDPIEFAGGLHLYAFSRNAPLSVVDPLGLAPVSIAPDADGPSGYKPEGEGGVIRLCWPGQTCDADGVYPPKCNGYPFKIVDGCRAYVKKGGQVVAECPFYNPHAPSWDRAFPLFGQAATGGRTNERFHDRHPDWPRPPRKPDCSCR